MQIGMLYAGAAYILWGLFPIYFKALQNVPPLEILWHRIAWAFVFLLMVLAVRRQWSWIAKVARRPRVLSGFAASSVLLSVNWYIYIWSVNHGHVVDTSLGYFMTPLVSVVLGFLLLRERLRPAHSDVDAGIAAVLDAILAIAAGSMDLPRTVQRQGFARLCGDLVRARLVFARGIMAGVARQNRRTRNGYVKTTKTVDLDGKQQEMNRKAYARGSQAYNRFVLHLVYSASDFPKALL